MTARATVVSQVLHMESLVQMAVEDHVRHIRSMRDAFAQSLYAVTLGVWDASPGMPQSHAQWPQLERALIPAAEVDIWALGGYSAKYVMAC